MRLQLSVIIAVATLVLTSFFAIATERQETTTADTSRQVVPNIAGEYVEARTCDVWTGPCFSNSEINLSGDHAVLAWKIDKGSWDGVRLDALKVVAAVDADGTLGTDAEGKIRAVVFIDQGASEEQGKALLSVAATLAPQYLKNIVAVHRQGITYQRRSNQVHVEVGDGAIVNLRTTPLSRHCDVICGNEEKAYPSLARTAHSECAKTVSHFFGGKDLGPTWSDPHARSAMVGRFEL